MADTPGTVVVAVALSVVAVAGFLLLPQLVSAAVADLHFSERQAGLLSSLLMAGSALAAASSVLWVRRLPWRRVAAVAAAGLAAANGASLLFHSFGALLLLQGCAGFFGGALYSLALTVLSDSRHPDRSFGYSVAAQVAFQVCGLLAGPTLIQKGGFAGLLGLFLVLNLLAVAIGRRLPDAGRERAAPPDIARRVHAPLVFAFLGCFLFFFNVGCYWTYIGLIGESAGIHDQPLANLLAAGVACGIAGALLASWLGERRGHRLPLTAGCLMTVAAALLLGPGMRWPGFAGSLALYNIAWNFSLTYQYSAVNVVDRSGRGVALAPAFHSAGGAAGPAVAAFLVSAPDYLPVVWLVSASAVASLVLFLWSMRRAA